MSLLIEDIYRSIPEPTISYTAQVWQQQHNQRDSSWIDVNGRVPESGVTAREEALLNSNGSSHPSDNRASELESATPMVMAEVQREEAERYNQQTLAATVATALERGLDRELHQQLQIKSKEANTLITRICNDHSDNFLRSVARLVSLGQPGENNVAAPINEEDDVNDKSQTHTSSCMELKEKIESAGAELASDMGTGGKMLSVATKLEIRRDAHRKARAMKIIIHDCYQVAYALEQGRKYASKSRPRAALDEVEKARRMLREPLSPFLVRVFFSNDNNQQREEGNEKIPQVLTLADTPFGKRANELLPKIEGEVLAGARKGLSKWFVHIRGGTGASAGAAALRKCAHSVSIGASEKISAEERYEWRALHSRHLISRGDGRVAKATRILETLFTDKYIQKDLKQISSLPKEKGIARKAEMIAICFSWYRCWDADKPHHLEGSGGKGLKSAVSSSAAQNRFRLGVKSGRSGSTQWINTLIPSMLLEDNTKDENILIGLSENAYPVHRAKATFTLLGKAADFREQYEINRFGDMRIQGSAKTETHMRSSLSSLTGDDVSVGTDRFFHAKILPHLCASVVGFSAVEAALELGIFDSIEVDTVAKKIHHNMNGNSGSQGIANVEGTIAQSTSASQYERGLIAELGLLVRSRAAAATLAELNRAASLLNVMRLTLRMVYPSSQTRRFDKELLVVDNDLVLSALKVSKTEQKAATMRAALEDRYMPMPVLRRSGLLTSSSARQDSKKSAEDIAREVYTLNMPFGLSQLIVKPSAEATLSRLDPTITNMSKQKLKTSTHQQLQHTFSTCVPTILRNIHARSIVFSSFILNFEELGQKFNTKFKQRAGSAGYVLDNLEDCIGNSAVALSERVEDDDVSVRAADEVVTAIQMTANMNALLQSLPHLYAVVVKGMCHIGLVRAENVEDVFRYADASLVRAEDKCKGEYSSCYSAVYEISRNKINELINFSMDNVDWVRPKVTGEQSGHVQTLISFMRNMFSTLDHLDASSREGILLSCCGHIGNRLVYLLSGDVNEYSRAVAQGDEQDLQYPGLSPIQKIDAYGLKNMAIDVRALKTFASTLDVQNLHQSFDEIDRLSSAMIDPDLPLLLRPENQGLRSKRYPFLSLERLKSIIERYVVAGIGSKMFSGTSMFSGGEQSSNSNVFMLDKKDVLLMTKLIDDELGL